MPFTTEKPLKSEGNKSPTSSSKGWTGQPTYQHWLAATAFLFIAFAALNTAGLGRRFVKNRISSFFILEVAALGWGIFAAFSPKRFSANQWFRALWSTIIFCVWGIFLFAIDLFGFSPLWRNAPWDRMFQHGLLFVYPVLWMTMGYWLGQEDMRWSRWLIVGAVIVNALPNLGGSNVINLSLGPLVAIPFMYCMTYSVIPGDRRWRFAAGALALLPLTFFPFSQMWLESMQRTTLQILILEILLTPWLLRTDQQSAWGYCGTSAIGLGLLLVALFQAPFLVSISQPTFFVQQPASEFTLKHKKPTDVRHPAMSAASRPPREISQAEVNHQPIVDHFRNNLFRSMQHGEDNPNETSPRRFQARTRRFMWNSALNQWRGFPFTGVGFIPEVPSHTDYNIPNNEIILGTPPVSGPHNSYISILTRMGLIGLGIFVALALQIGKHMRTLAKQTPLSITDIVLITVPINGAIYALWNVGFESPHNCVLLWLFAGLLVARVDNPRPEPLHENPPRP